MRQCTVYEYYNGTMGIPYIDSIETFNYVESDNSTMNQFNISCNDSTIYQQYCNTATSNNIAM